MTKVREISLKLEKYINPKDNKEKYKYINVGVLFINENGAPTGINLKPYLFDLLKNADVFKINLNAKNDAVNLHIFDNKEDKGGAHFDNDLSQLERAKAIADALSDKIPF